MYPLYFLNICLSFILVHNKTVFRVIKHLSFLSQVHFILDVSFPYIKEQCISLLNNLLICKYQLLCYNSTQKFN